MGYYRNLILKISLRQKPDYRFDYYHQAGGNLILKNILRIETWFPVQLLSLSRWKPYTKKYPKDRNLIPGSIIITEQLEALYWKNPKDKNLIPGSIVITEQVETLYWKYPKCKYLFPGQVETYLFPEQLYAE